MRVTSSSFPNTLITQLGSLATRQAQLQSQVATGQRVQRPEDDPGAMRRVLDLQTESKTVGQYQRNIVRQQELATDTFSAVKALKRISDRAGEIATLADGLRRDDRRDAGVDGEAAAAVVHDRPVVVRHQVASRGLLEVVGHAGRDGGEVDVDFLEGE